jgi:hypothetical protein
MLNFRCKIKFFNQGNIMRNTITSLSFLIVFFTTSQFALAESLRCKGDIVDIDDTKAEVLTKCGAPVITDSFCEKFMQKIQRSDGTQTQIESCENVDIWTYNPGAGQFLTNLYFAQGKLREMRYGDRVK